MSFLLNPMVSGLMDTQLSNYGYLVRGWSRVSGEDIGLPKATPDTRKMDYGFRDVYSIFMTAYATELAYRMIDQGYVVPNLLKILGLDKLQETYHSKSIHTPEFAKKMLINNYSKALPAVLQPHMLGSLVDSRSYYAIPGILEDLKIPALKAKHAPQQEINELELIVRHLRRTFKAEEYLENYLKDKITPDEAKAVRKQLNHLDRIASWIESAQQPTSTREVLERLQKKATLKSCTPEIKKLAQLSEKELERIFRGDSIFDLLNDIRKHGYQKGREENARFKNLYNNKALKALRENSTALRKLSQLLQRASKDSLYQKTSIVQELKKLSGTELRLAIQEQGPIDFIKNVFSHGPNQAVQLYKDSKAFSSHGLLSTVRESIMLPWVNRKYRSSPVINDLFKDLSQSKVNLKNLKGLFEGSRFWVKLPLSIFFFFIFTGVIGNTFDNKIIQPYQREIVKRRGNVREFIGPLYAGIPVGVGAFAALMLAPPVKKLGYFWSFALSGLAGLSAYAGTTFTLFKQRISAPRAYPVSQYPSVPPQAVQSQFKASPSTFKPLNTPQAFYNNGYAYPQPQYFAQR